MTDDLHKLSIDKTDLAARHSHRTKPKFLIIVGLLVLLAGILIYTLMVNRKVTVETVTVSQVYPSQTFTLLNASGYVVAQRKASVASKATGQLIWLGVEEGSQVRTGDVLARLENRDTAAAKSQAVANVAAAKSSLETAQVELKDAEQNFVRQKSLLAQGIISQAEFDAAESRLNRGKAVVKNAQSMIRVAEAVEGGAEATLDYTLIRAPFDGVVLTKNADIGDIVTPLGAAANAKAAVVTLADMASLQVEADVSEANLAKIRVGQPCEIQLDAFPELRFRGMLQTIVPTADRSKASVMVKVRFLDKDRRVLPEMSAKVAFLERPVMSGEQRPKTAVNPAAVISRNGRKLLFLVKDGRAIETPVTLGGAVGDQVEVLQGVKAGEKIVLKPVERLKNHTRIVTSEK